MEPGHPQSPSSADSRAWTLRSFGSGVVDRARAAGGRLQVRGGEIILPGQFGFCRGVERALAMLEEAVTSHATHGGKLFLLGQIIHNPWVNDYFLHRGVQLLQASQIEQLEKFVSDNDWAVIPAFGVPLPVERRLKAIGCRVIDTSCGDVRRLWVWTERAARDGYGVLIFGRSRHDETVVTKSRLEEVGGKYLVVGSLDEAGEFCRMIRRQKDAGDFAFAKTFDRGVTNASGIEPFQRLAQVSQTTMLYDETMKLRDLVSDAYTHRYGPGEAAERLLFEPTVCRATQDRQQAAIELCQSKPDLLIVVGGFGSSNTHHLFELAGGYAPAYFIEDASAIRSGDEILAIGPGQNKPVIMRSWLPSSRPLRIGVLAGASSPEIVVGQVLEKLDALLG